SSFELFEYRNNKTFVKINVSNDATATTTVPATLTTLEAIDTSQVVRTRTFRLDMNNGQLTINGKAMDINRIDEVVPLGDTEIWDVSNTMGIDHNFHMHATHFRIIERNGSAANVDENEKGYKDTVYLRGNESVKLLVKMEDYLADANSPYMFHCHFLEHEDDGMMGQFTVV
ncbi:MAG TPA: copper oxidase, partial [Gammaproteobacteria bacterium]|nr:copper oxidase [Gammaproteobacteria bacterium]